MSKIQKALEALRNGDAVDTSANARAEQRKARRERSAASQVPVGAPSNEHFEQLIPANRIQVDFEKLVESGFLARSEDQDLIADQFRRVKRPVLQLAFDSDLVITDYRNLIMVASALPGAGKSFCSLNLAQSIATERDIGTVLVDADVLKPSISRGLGLQDQPGLIDFLLDDNIQLQDVLIATDLNDIIVLPAGRRHPDATELLASRRMRELMKQLADHFPDRAVVFDTPPLLITNEAQVLAERMGQIVLVIEARVSSQESVNRALGLLNRDKPINAILNKSRSATVSGYQSDDYGYYPYPNKARGDEK